MGKNKILYVCSVNKLDHELRFIEEISRIELLLLNSSERTYDFFPKIGVSGSSRCRRIVIGLYAEKAPDVVHFSLHGDFERGLKFVGEDGNQPEFSDAVFFKNLFNSLVSFEKKVNCVVFSACHSKEIAETVASFVNVAIGIDGEIPVEAMLKFNEGFYVSLLDGYPIKNCYEEGVRSIKQWEQGIKIIGGGLAYSERIHYVS